uniref:ATP synthase F0 subunit 8 n=1 Tax=Spathoderma clenchi TaxID=1638910 RepID=A0A343YNC5_9MOLL|nr:ATP synthase F0 subunit 8 [Spathoderma clenchi]
MPQLAPQSWITLNLLVILVFYLCMTFCWWSSASSAYMFSASLSHTGPRPSFSWPWSTA